MKGEIVPAVLDVLKLHGFRCAHFRPGMTSRGRWLTAMSGDTGFPDVIAAGHGHILAVEVKGKDGYLRPQQRAWRDVLVAAGVEFHRVRPQDIQTFSDRVRELAQERGPEPLVRVEYVPD